MPNRRCAGDVRGSVAFDQVRQNPELLRDISERQGLTVRATRFLSALLDRPK